MDDDELVGDIAIQALEELGFEADLARDGTEAIELYKKAMQAGSPYRAVIMDITIPGGMGGKEAIKYLYEIDPQVKAIVSSGYANDPVMAEYKDYGFAGVLAKPYTLDALEDVLMTVIG
jgi:CheY-like chemotaxis protein